jgi:TolB-like protein
MATALIPARRPTSGCSATSACKAPAAQRRSIAVLPFRDMSPGKDQGWFADGLTEEILNSSHGFGVDGHRTHVRIFVQGQ